MGCVKQVVPWIIDPVGMAIQKTTGFGYTPGGMANKLLNPPKMRVNQPTYAAPPPRQKITLGGGGGGGTVTMPAPPAPPPPPPPQWRPTPAPEPGQRAEHEGAGASASTDRTRGLVAGKKKGPGGFSLLS